MYLYVDFPIDNNRDESTSLTPVTQIIDAAAVLWAFGQHFGAAFDNVRPATPLSDTGRRCMDLFCTGAYSSLLTLYLHTAMCVASPYSRVNKLTKKCEVLS